MQPTVRRLFIVFEAVNVVVCEPMLKFDPLPPRIPGDLEGWESGRIRQFGELVYPRGTASSNLAPSATHACARWGASGPL